MEDRRWFAVQRPAAAPVKEESTRLWVRQMGEERKKSERESQVEEGSVHEDDGMKSELP